MLSLFETAAKSRVHGDLPPLLLRLTNFLGYLFLVLVNVLSSIGAFGGTNAEISAKFQTPLTPAGWAFAIWGVIFALQGAGVIYQVVNSGYREGGWKTSVVQKIGYGWQLGWLSQDLWQVLFARESVPGMWLAAVALIAASVAFQVTLHRLNGTTHELRARGYAGMPAAAYIFYKLPTSVNAAWLSVATALGLLIVPVAYGVAQTRLVAPAAVLAVVVTAGGVWRLALHRDAAYGLTLIWALAAVAANHSGNVPRAVKVVGVGCLVVLALGVVAALVRIHRERSSASLPAAGVPPGSGFMQDSYGPYGPYALYGSYSDRRVLLSDSDTLAGGGAGGHDGIACAEEGGGLFTAALGQPGDYSAAHGGGRGDGGGRGGGEPGRGPQGAAPAAEGLAAVLLHPGEAIQQQRQQTPLPGLDGGVPSVQGSGGSVGGSRRGSLGGVPAGGLAPWFVGPGPGSGLAWGQPAAAPAAAGPQIGEGVATRVSIGGGVGAGGVGAGGAAGGAPPGRRVRFQLDEDLRGERQRG